MYILCHKQFMVVAQGKSQDRYYFHDNVNLVPKHIMTLQSESPC